MTIKVHIMHVPDAGRDDNVCLLTETFSREGFDWCVHTDPARHGAVHTWAGVMDCMATSDSGPWSIQLNDDAVPFASTADHVLKALRFSPRPMLGLAWVGKRRGMKAVGAGAPYVVGPYLPAGLAIAYERHLLPALATFSREALPSGYPHDDILACLWAQRFAQPAFVPALTGRSLFATLQLPSLVGHASYPSAAATVEHGYESWWSRRAVRDNYLARRDDEAQVREFLERRLG